jgi:predicted nucleic acid-binding protein
LSKSIRDFKDNFRDYMIASHAYLPPRIVITNNKKDFSFLGKRVKTPTEFKKQCNY